MKNIPRGIEVIVKKASVDPAFKKLLLEKRADAAKTIDLKLEPSEIAMLNTVPQTQLESIISRTVVFPKQRKAFLGKVAALMVVALGASTIGCGSEDNAETKGIRPERLTEGCRPDRPIHEQSESEAP